MTLDEARAARPELGFALYAMEPGGEVVLEVFADGDVFTFRGESEDEVLSIAFPPLPDVFN